MLMAHRKELYDACDTMREQLIEERTLDTPFEEHLP
jgi:hypothetical protein